MFVVAKAAGLILTPPGIILVLGALGLLLYRRSRTLGLSLVGTSLLLLLVLSLPPAGRYLMTTLERDVHALPPADASLRANAGAIVVLGAGRDPKAPEYGGDTVSVYTLERLRYAVRLHRATGLPLLVTGGAPFGEAVSEAELMQQALTHDFGVRAQWLETKSRNTQENAAYSRPILESAGIRKVFVVTHAWHMPRSRWSFAGAGIDAVPAPMGFTMAGETTTLLDFVPSAGALLRSSRALQEHLGLLWYRTRYGAEPARRERGAALPTAGASSTGS
jgi:uncharacterized SAM-binding protein YcdF (DUF218 family)